MERLTRRINNNKITAIKGHGCNYSAHSFDCQDNEGRNKLRAALEKLADYEDLEEQGLLVRLPVPIGTIVYCIYTSMTGKNATILADRFTVDMCKPWGTFVFATEEEAEKKLKEMN